MKPIRICIALLQFYFLMSMLEAAPLEARLAPKGECIKCKFKNGEFKGLDLTQSRLLFIDLKEANLGGANLEGADLRFSEINKATLDEANLKHVNLAGGRARKASFHHANLDGANLTYADLYRGDFSQASLKGADLTGANLISADFTEADLSDADLTGARVAEAKLQKAKLCATRMPDGVKNPDCALGTPEPPPANGIVPTLRIPPRESHAPSGSAFLKSTMGMTLAEREAAILGQLKAGNVPNFLRKLKPVILSARHGGAVHQATLWVTPDYLAIGSDEDFIRIPLGGVTAQKIAVQYGASLPTSRIVDDIYLQADMQLKPIFFPWGQIMRSTGYFIKHQLAIEERLKGMDHRPLLLAGHKKDVILSNQLNEIPRRVAIYGWHERHGQPVQPVSITHQIIYADYSHGVRLIADTILCDGKAMALTKALTDPELSEMVSDEGPILTPDIYLAEVRR